VWQPVDATSDVHMNEDGSLRNRVSNLTLPTCDGLRKSDSTHLKRDAVNVRPVDDGNVRLSWTNGRMSIHSVRSDTGVKGGNVKRVPPTQQKALGFFYKCAPMTLLDSKTLIGNGMWGVTHDCTDLAIMYSFRDMHASLENTREHQLMGGNSLRVESGDIGVAWAPSPHVRDRKWSSSLSETCHVLQMLVFSSDLNDSSSFASLPVLFIQSNNTCMRQYAYTAKMSKLVKKGKSFKLVRIGAEKQE